MADTAGREKVSSFVMFCSFVSLNMFMPCHFLPCSLLLTIVALTRAAGRKFVSRGSPEARTLWRALTMALDEISTAAAAGGHGRDP